MLFWFLVLIIPVYAAPGDHVIIASDSVNSNDIPGLLMEAVAQNTNVLIDKSQIEVINKNIRKKGYVEIPHAYPDFYFSRTISNHIYFDFQYVKRSGLYDRNNRLAAETGMLVQLLENCALNNIKNQYTRLYFAICISNSSLRSVPGQAILMQKKNDQKFDIAQVTLIQTGETAVIFHTSRDKKWFYVRTRHSRGWISSSSLVLVARSSAAEWANSQKQITILEPKVKVFFNSAGEDGYYLYMGKRIPWDYSDENNYYIVLPAGKGYITNYIPKDSGISESNLPFTVYNAARQAVKMLGEPYSWGGADGSPDCSGFCQRLFLCFGLELPKSSKQQIGVLEQIRLTIKKNENICRLEYPFTVLLYYPGHIMLYAGKIGETPLVIHNKWSVHLPGGREEHVGRIIISDLMLGAGGKRRSLLDNVTTAGKIAD